MSPEAVTTERVYTQLKADIVGGRYPPHSEIVIAAIAREYAVSIAPVRDSAQRLVGERLLVALHGGGFALPALTEKGLHDLLFWHGHLVRAAVKMRRSDPTQSNEVNFELPAGSAEALATAAEKLFYSLALQSKNEELPRAVWEAGDRLRAVRLTEPSLLAGVERELRMVQSLTAAGRDRDLIQAIWAYHRRRLRRVGQLVSAVGAGSGVRDGSELHR